MKQIVFAIALMSFSMAYGQKIKEANVYSSNLEENMYYNNYDGANKLISGINFLVLCDGDNSQDCTPPFEVSLYLIPEGSTSESDVKIIKTYPLKGIYHMGSHEFKDESVSIKDIDGLTGERYRLGIWVNSNHAFTEDGQDNAMLFKNAIDLSSTANQSPVEQRGIQNSFKNESKGEQKETVCSVSDSELQEIVSNIKEQSFESTQVSLVKQIMGTKKCFKAMQIKQLIEIFSFENTKIDIAKYCFEYCTDKDNYYKVNSSFSFPHSVDELTEFIKEKQ